MNFSLCSRSTDLPWDLACVRVWLGRDDWLIQLVSGYWWRSWRIMLKVLAFCLSYGHTCTSAARSSIWKDGLIPKGESSDILFCFWVLTELEKTPRLKKESSDYLLPPWTSGSSRAAQLFPRGHSAVVYVWAGSQPYTCELALSRSLRVSWLSAVVYGWAGSQP